MPLSSNKWLNDIQQPQTSCGDAVNEIYVKMASGPEHHLTANLQGFERTDTTK